MMFSDVIQYGCVLVRLHKMTVWSQTIARSRKTEISFSDRSLYFYKFKFLLVGGNFQ